MDIRSNKMNGGGGCSQKLLSIVIPTYNRETYLKRTLDSFIEEIKKYDLTDFVDIIVSDNASIDNTPKLLKEYQEFYPTFFSYNINQENLGFGKNYCKVVELAQSKYVFTCGDDDIYRFGIIGVILEILKNNELDILVLDSYDKELISDELEFDESLFTRFKNKDKFLLDSKTLFITFISICIFKRTFFMDTPYFDDMWPHTIKIINANENTIFARYKEKCVFADRTADAWHKDGEKFFITMVRLLELYERSNCSIKVKTEHNKKIFINLICNKVHIEKLDVLIEKTKNFKTCNKLIPPLQGELSILGTLKFTITNRAFHILKYPQIYKNSYLRKIIFLIMYYNRWALKLIKKCYNVPKDNKCKQKF